MTQMARVGGSVRPERPIFCQRFSEGHGGVRRFGIMWKKGVTEPEIR